MTSIANISPASRDGNCLYNSASLVLCGDQKCNGCLCFLVAEELYFNAEYYATHEIFGLCFAVKEKFY